MIIRFLPEAAGAAAGIFGHLRNPKDDVMVLDLL